MSAPQRAEVAEGAEVFRQLVERRAVLRAGLFAGLGVLVGFPANEASAQTATPAALVQPDLDTRYAETRKQIVALTREMQALVKSNPDAVTQDMRRRGIAFVAELKSIEVDPEALTILKKADPQYVIAVARWSLGFDNDILKIKGPFELRDSVQIANYGVHGLFAERVDSGKVRGSIPFEPRVTATVDGKIIPLPPRPPVGVGVPDAERKPR